MASLSTKHVAEAIFTALRGKTGTTLEKTLADSISFLEKNRLLSKSPAILKHIEYLESSAENRLIATVKSPRPLQKNTTQKIVETLKKHYKAHAVTLHEELDESLIGGIRVEVHDDVWDMSLRAKLNKLQSHLLNN